VLEVMHDHPMITSFFNWLSAFSVVGSLLGILPHVAAALGVIWYCVLLYDRFITQRHKTNK
jgi:hypothetical protein